MKVKQFRTIFSLITAISLHPAHAQVLRYTIGIDVNCPAGLGE